MSSILVPYEDFKRLSDEAATLRNVTSVMTTEFPDDGCQLLAVKSLLGIKTEEESEIEEPEVDPEEPEIEEP